MSPLCINKTRTLPLLLPYDVIDYLIGTCNLPINDSLLDQYWSHLDSVKDPWALSTKPFREAVDKHVIPLGFFGDEACMGLVVDPYSQIYGLFMSVILFRPTSTRMSRFLLWSVDSHRVHSVEGTFFPVLKLICESFNRLTEEGVHGRRFVVSELRGDQVFFRYLFQHESWWRSTNVCFRCEATTKPTNLSYAIYESEDGWNTTLRTTADFIIDELPHDKLCGLDVFFGGWFSSPKSQVTGCSASQQGQVVEKCCHLHLCWEKSERHPAKWP